MSADALVQSALLVVTEQLQEGIAAPKCHRCGCMQQTVDALAKTEAGEQLADTLARARATFVPKKYDCLGCEVCFPAIAANAFVEAFPEAGASLDLCPTEAPEARAGWPPLPGEYTVIRYGAPVAVCTLNDEALARRLAEHPPESLSVVGTMHTENLGIERLIQNVISNPNIRFVVLCGQDTQQVVGHLPGQSLASLVRHGLDAQGRIIGARGKRPVLKNVTREEVVAFTRQVELVSMIGVDDLDAVRERVRECAVRDPGAYPDPIHSVPLARIQASEPARLTLDGAGYFVVYPDPRARRLIVEHYTNQGVLNCVLEGTTTGALYSEAIRRELLTRLDHAAYLGRELACAQQSLLDGTPFVQDAAPGPLVATAPMADCNAESACGCPPAPKTKGCCA